MTSSTRKDLLVEDRVVSRFQQLRELAIEYEGSEQSIPLRPPDISTRGMFINTNRHFPQGAVLKVRFTLARTGREVRARAEVRYSLAGVGIGVEFVDISLADQLAIEAELALSS